MPEGRYRYRADVLEALWRHGVHPTDQTSPALVHEFVGNLYRYEIRRLRDRMVRREFPKKEYLDRVVQLRKRYPVISMKPDAWLIQ
jgi:hypothetical protein